MMLAFEDAGTSGGGGGGYTSTATAGTATTAPSSPIVNTADRYADPATAQVLLDPRPTSPSELIARPTSSSPAARPANDCGCGEHAPTGEISLSSASSPSAAAADTPATLSTVSSTATSAAAAPDPREALSAIGEGFVWLVLACLLLFAWSKR
jgi:hypothetical protein